MAHAMALAAAVTGLLAVAPCHPPSVVPAPAQTGSGSPATSPAPSSAPVLPLRTSGRWIVDQTGARVKLAGVNWYGAESPDYVVGGLDRADLGDIAHRIKTMGFNCVRLPFSNEMVETDPPVDDARLAANPALIGQHALEVYDAVVSALAAEGLLIVIDDHTSRADWCCSDTDGNGLWYSAAFPESAWLADWSLMAARYASTPQVVGADLRNEPRSSGGRAASWGGDPATDWHAAAERGGAAVLAANANLLVIVEGIDYATNLTGVYFDPVRLPVADRLVYEAHDYSWDAAIPDLKTALGAQWGYIITQGKSFTAPVWVGEFGTCHAGAACVDAASGQGAWFAGIRRYLEDGDMDWCYWALNGTQSSGMGRALGAEEGYGVLDTTWTRPASSDLWQALVGLQAITQRP